MSTSFSHKALMEKMNSNDPDYRYMALNDLQNEFNKPGFRMEASVETKLLDKNLELLNDPAGEVKSVAVECLGVFVQHVRDASLSNIINQLTSGLLQGKDEERDMAGTALKNIVNTLPPLNQNRSQSSTITVKVVDLLCPQIINGIMLDTAQIKLECLDLLHDLLKSYSALLADQQDEFVQCLLPQLQVSRQAVRKRAIVCLGPFCSFCREDLFTNVATEIIDYIKKEKNTEKLRTYIHAMGAITRSAGYRAGKFFNQCVPRILKFIDDDDMEDDELSEVCFMTLEAFVRRAPKDVAPFIDDIVAACVEFLPYDPNYVDNDSGDEYSDDEDYSDDDYDDYSDDNDVSWKVRLACSKTVRAIIISRPDLLAHLYQEIAPLLVERFREREENVKLDIFETFVELLNATRIAVKYSASGKDHLDSLRAQMDTLGDSLPALLENKSFKTRIGTCNTLRELVELLPGALDTCLDNVIPGLVTSLNDDSNGSTPLKIDTLLFIQALFDNHSAAAIQPHLEELCPPLFSSVGESFFKIIAEALRACTKLINILRPPANDDGEVEMGENFDYTPFVQPLYDATFPRLQDQQLDQEVKDCAIGVVGTLVARLSDGLDNGLQECLAVLCDRLDNEITRLSTVKAFAQIASSPLQVDLDAIFNNLVPALALFLRKSDRPLKINTLGALDALVTNYSGSMNSDLTANILEELSPLISDEDLHLSHLAIQLSVSILEADKAALDGINDTILPSIYELIQSPLLQGAAMNSVLALHAALLATKDKRVSFAKLLDNVVGLKNSASKGKGKESSSSSSSSGVSSYNRQSLSSIAKCVAVLCVNTTAKNSKKTIGDFVGDLQGDSDVDQLLAILTIGEAGLLMDLSSVSGVFDATLACFESSSEEMKTGASFALGGITVGAMDAFLPDLLAEIENSPKRQYLLLHSLKEIIVRQGGNLSGLDDHLDSVLGMLFSHCESKEEGTRNVVAECLGRVALLNPGKLLGQLQDNLESDSANVRATVVTALRFLVSGDEGKTKEIKPVLNKALELIGDQDLDVRRATLMTLNYVAHNKVALVYESLDDLMPAVYAETVVNEDLKRKVVVGPFTRIVDDGLDLRKAAFSVMNTLLACAFDVLNLSDFLERVSAGLGDDHDIQSLSHTMLGKLCAAAPVGVLESLDKMVEPLNATLTKKMKKNAIQQEIEKNEEIVKSALRAIKAVSNISDVESNIQFAELLAFIEGDEKLGPIFAEL